MYRMHYSFLDFGRISSKYGVCAAVKNDWKHTNKAVRRGLKTVALVGGVELLCLGALCTADYASVVDLTRDFFSSHGEEMRQYHTIGASTAFALAFAYTYFSRRSPFERLSEADQKFLKHYGIMKK